MYCSAQNCKCMSRYATSRHASSRLVTCRYGIENAAAARGSAISSLAETLSLRRRVASHASANCTISYGTVLYCIVLYCTVRCSRTEALLFAQRWPPLICTLPYRALPCLALRCRTDWMRQLQICVDLCRYGGGACRVPKARILLLAVVPTTKPPPICTHPILPYRIVSYRTVLYRTMQYKLAKSIAASCQHLSTWRRHLSIAITQAAGTSTSRHHAGRNHSFEMIARKRGKRKE
jgi:hypothetical protein